MKAPLVSIITPCYNGGQYINKLLDSVLMQTYPNIEMIIVDDGSTDDSGLIVKSYSSKFKEKGYKLLCVTQEQNKGQSFAINRALKLVMGEYLLWPDADDYYSVKESVAHMVKAIKDTDETVSLVRVFYKVVDREGNMVSRLRTDGINRYKTDLFEDCLFKYGNGFWGAAGGYMAKMKVLDKTIPGRNIYTERGAGQNWQLCLPLLYKNKCLTIEKYLYTIVSHDDSHSRNSSTHNKRQQIYIRTIKHTLSELDLDSKYRKYLIQKFKSSVYAGQAAKRPGLPLRTYLKRAIKALMPYGLVKILKRT